MKRLSIYLFSICALSLFSGCEALLEEPVKSEYTESTLLASKSGLESVLADAYGKGNDIRNIVKRSDMTTDLLTQSGGGENGTAVPLINFRWDPSNELEAFSWMQYWEMIRNANVVLSNIPDASGFTNEEDKMKMEAEARFLRVWAYYFLWDQFGPMPIRRSVDDPLELPRASEEEFYEFMETELSDIINAIYPANSEPAYGRANKGAALGFQCLWYLNTHQWQKCMDSAQEIIDGKAGKKYELFKDYNMLFALENERNNEFIWQTTCLSNSGSTNVLLATDLPLDFKEGIDGYLEGVVNSKWSNFASNYKLYDDFYYSFDENDQRKGRIVTKYKDSKGNTVDLLDASHQNDTRAIKFPPDPAASGNAHGNDFPLIRYAEILLAKAEALLELKGINQESVDLINQIRNRAGLGNLSKGDFSTKEALLEQILNERKWEFFHEGKRRRDLIRTDKYIQCAHDRGIANAQNFHVWFPIRQSAIDANSLLKQNDGY
nr:RagB/SusD family nutrient uptake outer membrane protein [Parabacteroides goldsteinii]